MTERAYTVAEIDRMRKAIGRYGWPPNSGAYYPAERAAEIENRLRTYMLAGIDPDVLAADLEKPWNEALARQQSMRQTGVEFMP